MSIIHDALKKVQQTNPQANHHIQPAPAQTPGQTPEPIKTKDQLNIPLLVAALCAVVAMLFAALPQLAVRRAPPAPITVVQPQAEESKPAVPSNNTIAQVITGAVTVPAVPATQPVAEQPQKKPVDPNDPLSSIQIEGVMEMGGKKAVLINGNVYEEGQTIYGRIITNVTFDTLTIMENGQKRTFPIKP